jgi:hypothetical protein
MTSSKTIVIVEDEDVKFRTLCRLARRMLPELLGVDEIAIARAADKSEALRILFMLERDCAFVLTDWCFPITAGGPIVTGAGLAVVDWCTDEGIPFGIISGHDPEPELAEAWLPWGGELPRMREALLARLRA